MKHFPRWAHGQRLGLSDISQLPVSTIRALAQVGAEVMGTGHVLHGWEVTSSGTVITVHRGAAISGLQLQGEMHHGVIVSGGEPTQDLDLGSWPDATYGVYIRGELAPGQFENRTFWDPVATPEPTTATQNTATRYVEGWSMNVSESNPGADWVHIADATKAGAALTIVDRRKFLFDLGGEGGTSWPKDDADRALSRPQPIHTLGEFCSMVLAQLGDIIGRYPASAKTNPFRRITNTVSSAGYMSLAALRKYIEDITEDLEERKINRQGSQIFSGSLYPPRDGGTYNIGIESNPFANGYFERLHAVGVPLAMAYIRKSPDIGISPFPEPVNISDISMKSSSAFGTYIEISLSNRPTSGSVFLVTQENGISLGLINTRIWSWRELDTNRFAVWSTNQGGPNSPATKDPLSTLFTLAVLFYHLP